MAEDVGQPALGLRRVWQTQGVHYIYLYVRTRNAAFVGAYHVVDLFLSVEGIGVLVSSIVASSVVVLREGKG